MNLKIENKNKVEKKSKIDNRKKYKKIPLWITLLMLFVLVTVCYVLTTWVKKTTKEYTPEDNFIRYSMGSTFQYDANLVLTREEGKTYIDVDEKIESDGTPIIYEGQSKYLLPVSMAYLDPNSEQGAKRVNYFSTMSYDLEQQKIAVSYNDKTKDMGAGFLYDGNGTFIFIEEVELKIGTIKYTLSPMSYARLFYKDSIEVYDIKEDNYIYLLLEGNNDVTATTKTNYSINLGTNVLTVNEAPRILFSNIEAMGVFE